MNRKPGSYRSGYVPGFLFSVFLKIPRTPFSSRVLLPFPGKVPLERVSGGHAYEAMKIAGSYDPVFQLSVNLTKCPFVRLR